jgi:hypothetical protein
MARSVSPDKQREYDELKSFFTHWETHLRPHRMFALDHPYNPINVLAGFERQLGVSRALAGLKQAVNDVLEGCEDFSPQQIAEADASLARAGAPTLTQLWQRRSRQYKAILRRGRLRNDTEFYLVSSILSDSASQVPSSERDMLGNMVASYESQRA